MSGARAPDTPASPTAGLRGRLLRHLVLLVIVTTGAITGVIVLGALGAVEELSEDLIRSAADTTDATLKGFFDPVRDQLRTVRLWDEWLQLDAAGTDELNALLVPVMRTHPMVSSVLLADDAGREHMLLRTDDGWTVRRTLGDEAPGKTVRHTFGPDLAPIGTEEQDLDYDPRRRPWFLEATTGGPETVRWTSPYIFFTSQTPGITASIGWERDGRTHVLGMDVLLSDISRFTTGLAVSEHGTAFVLDEQDRVVGLPRSERYADAANVATDVMRDAAELELPAVADAVRAWRERVSAAGVFAFESGDETWWAGFRPLELGAGRRVFVGVVVPEADVRGDLDRQRNAILVIAALALVGAVLLALRLNHAVDEQVESLVEEARQFGQYTLEGRIGQGGMGAVYRARHAMLRRPTAVKLLRAEQAGSEAALRRFESEVQQTARLTHPNTIRIYDYGRTPDGVFYYAMEYIAGVSLEDLVAKHGRIEPERVIHILRQACGSLQEAHRAGLVHRDIKPANIMLCERGGTWDFVKVLDFGLVWSAADVSRSAPAQDGNIAGTPMYIAPESVTDRENVDARSDLYALGAVGYYLLTGEVVFERKTVSELLVAHMESTPVRPSLRIAKPLPKDLENVLLACLAKNADDRPQSAALLSEWLGRCKDANGWGPADAEAWWSEHGSAIEAAARRHADASDGAQGPLTIDLHARLRPDDTPTRELSDDEHRRLIEQITGE